MRHPRFGKRGGPRQGKPLPKRQAPPLLVREAPRHLRRGIKLTDGVDSYELVEPHTDPYGTKWWRLRNEATHETGDFREADLGELAYGKGQVRGR